ncbi:MAG TPA: polyprenyl synthetase family protein [Pyrinomonadaceae bacterium]|jgi:geranylgeranyl pyrophosphate synthase|nr:polyprenyl synthetase family protein [Pyrinomonadaceae bacterium]
MTLKLYRAAYRQTFQEAHSISKRLINRTFKQKDTHLKGLLNSALGDPTPTEYPFLFRYSYSDDEQDYEKIKRLSAAIHLLQRSTFVIDDIFDLSGLRDRKKTVCKEYGTNYAIIAGEILQSLALETISLELESGIFKNKASVLKAFTKTVREVYLGQYLDIYNSSNHRIKIADYYRAISLTTGNFLANIAKSGALLANKSKSDTEILTKYGYYYGIAMQITDDMCDVVQKPSLTGKNFASDLVCRRMRLPFILALNLTDEKNSRSLRCFLRERNPSTADIHHIANLIEQCGAIDDCKIVAKRYISKSTKAISYLKDSLTKQYLTYLSEYLLEDQRLI